MTTGTVESTPPDAVPTERELLQEQLARHAAAMRRLDPLVRADAPDAVHQMRVSARRLRSILTVFADSFDPSGVELCDDLGWLVKVLGRARDLEVLRSRLEALVAELSAEVPHERPEARIRTELDETRVAARAESRAAMTSPRYLALLESVESWARAGHWTDRQDEPADQRTSGPLERSWSALERDVRRAERATRDRKRAKKLHSTRKAAKRLRYAAEAVVPVLGQPAAELADAAERIQDVLGEHHDAAVARAVVVELGTAAREGGEEVAMFDALRARLDTDMEAHEAAFWKLWGALDADRRPLSAR